jgi:hypothetical protein
MSDADFLLTELAEQEKQFQSARKPTLVLIPAFQQVSTSPGFVNGPTGDHVWPCAFVPART